MLGQIRAAGVRIWFYLTNEQLKFDSATDKFMVSAVAFAAELEREKASQRSRDALLGKAEHGFNTGGRVYGYDNVSVYAQATGGQQVRSHTEYRVDPAEAEVVRSIFHMYADGHGMKAVARTLNGDPAYGELSTQYFAGRIPSAPRKGTGSWAPSSIREMLYRERYLGKVPGEHRKVLRAGSRSRERQDNYLLADRPDLRIVDQELWERVQTRLRGRRQAYLAATHGECHGRPETGRTSRYLLSGLMRCACCGGSMVTTSVALGSGKTRRREPHYLCGYRHNRGSTVCANSRRVRIDEVDQRLLGAIERTILTPDAIDYVVNKVVERIQVARTGAPDRAQEMYAELQRLRRELDRFVALIASGNAPQRVLEEIAARERRAKELETVLAQLKVAQSTKLDVASIRALALARATDLRSTLYSDVGRVRRALQQILVGPIAFNLDDSGYRLEAQPRVGALFSDGAPITRIRLASPRGGGSSLSYLAEP